jgi:hypothetical protein
MTPLAPWLAGRIAASGARARYAWRLSSSVELARLRATSDALWARPWATRRTTTADGRLGIAYAGLRCGVDSLWRFLAERLSAPGAPALTEILAPAPEPIGTEPGDDIVVVCDVGRRVAALPRERALTLPLRVHQVVPTREPFDLLLGRLHKSDRLRFLKQRRERGWRWERAGGRQDLDLFYDRMHRPTMAARFGSVAVSEDRTTARECLLRSGHLFFLEEEGRRVGGALCGFDRRRGVLRYRLNGILDGDERWRQAGVLTAINYFLMEWASEHGVAAVDLSGGVPFVGRGIYQAKRRLHPDVVVAETPTRHLRYWLQVRRDTPAVRDFLVANPVLEVDDAGPAPVLRAVYFADRARPPRRDLRSGLDGDRVVDLDLDLALEGCRG